MRNGGTNPKDRTSQPPARLGFTLNLPACFPPGTNPCIAAERAALGVEREVDQRIVVEVDGAVPVEVAVEPAGATEVEATIRPRVVVEVHHTIEVRVAIVGVF